MDARLPPRTEQHPVALAIRYDMAFNRRDGEAITSVLDPAAELHEPDGSVHFGHAGARELIRDADGPRGEDYVIGSRYRRSDAGVNGFVLLARVDPTSGEPAQRLKLDVDFRIEAGRIIAVERSAADATARSEDGDRPALAAQDAKA
jgi:hypothetical protein